MSAWWLVFAAYAGGVVALVPALIASGADEGEAAVAAVLWPVAFIALAYDYIADALWR